MLGQSQVKLEIVGYLKIYITKRRRNNPKKQVGVTIGQVMYMAHRKVNCPKHLKNGGKRNTASKFHEYAFCQAQPQLNSTQPQLKLRLRLTLFPPDPPTHPATHPATRPPTRDSRLYTTLLHTS